MYKFVVFKPTKPKMEFGCSLFKVCKGVNIYIQSVNKYAYNFTTAETLQYISPLCAKNDNVSSRYRGQNNKYQEKIVSRYRVIIMRSSENVSISAIT